jgi:ubiquinone biosynthesis monooxygenase Coq7
LNPLWYAGSLSMGLIAGRLGDKWNLGFLAETERQVEAHLDGHLVELPGQDARSREIVDQMRSMKSAMPIPPSISGRRSCPGRSSRR